jgi:DEAD/DEAH box helicase domain-containing protein
LSYLAEESGFLMERERTFFWMADAYPAQDVSLAGGDLDNVLILEQGSERALGETDRESSLVTCHEGAIYQVQGVTWRIERFDHKNRRAYAKQVESDYYTEAQTDTDVRVLRLEECSRRDRADYPVAQPMPLPEGADAFDQVGEDTSVWRGEVHVTTVATLYKKIRFYTKENVGAGEVHLPPEELDTEAFMLTLSSETAAELGASSADGGTAWHALGELMRSTAPLFVRCQPSDLGLSTQVRSTHFGRPTLVLYDRVQGGVGLSDLLLAAQRELLAACLDVVQRCACERGCPACVGPVEEVGAEGKAGVLRLLEHLSQGPALEPCEPAELDAPEDEVISAKDLGPEGHVTRGALLPE